MIGGQLIKSELSWGGSPIGSASNEGGSSMGGGAEGRRSADTPALLNGVILKKEEEEEEARLAQNGGKPNGGCKGDCELSFPRLEIKDQVSIGGRRGGASADWSITAPGSSLASAKGGMPVKKEPARRDPTPPPGEECVSGISEGLGVTVESGKGIR